MRCARARMRLLLGALALIGLGVTGTGCLGERCSEQQVLVEGMCRADPSADGRAPTRDGGPVRDGAPAADGDSGSGRPPSGLGEVCSGARPCEGEASYCVLQLGQTEGYCSLRDCTVAPESCPAGYVCRDLTQFMPGFPLFCSRLRP